MSGAMPTIAEGSLEERGIRTRQVVAVLSRRVWIIAGVAVLIPAVVYALVAFQSRHYRAEVLVQPAPLVPSDTIVSPQVSSGWFASPSPSFVALLAKTPPVRIEAGHLLHRSPAQLGTVDTIVHKKTGWLTIAATDRSSRAAISVANAFATAIAKNLQLRTRNSIATLVANLQRQLPSERDPVVRGQIAAQIAAFRAFRPEDSAPIQVIEPAVAASPVSNNPGLIAAIALIFALFAGWRLARFAERTDDRIHDPEEIERLVEAPPLAEISAGSNPGPEAFLRLRDSVVHLGGQDQRATLVVTSPLKADGRTSVAVGLAKAFTAAGRNVVLVDADLRDPQVAARVVVAPRPGLAEVLTGGSLSEALHTGLHRGLTMLPAGVPAGDVADLVGSTRMRLVLQELAARFEVVVVDTPPLLVASDALALVHEATGVLLVARLDHTSSGALSSAKQILERAAANVLGPVVTGAHARSTGLQSALAVLPRRRVVAHAPGD